LPNYILSSRSPQWVTNINNITNIWQSEPALIDGMPSAFGFPLQDDQDIFGVMIS
jgi:hypothetical protein